MFRILSVAHAVREPREDAMPGLLRPLVSDWSGVAEAKISFIPMCIFLSPPHLPAAMWTLVSQLWGRAKRQVVSDLTADPYLRYIFVLAIILTAFWCWHLIPNFATQDEEDRLFDAMTVIGAMVVDPGLDALQQAVTQGRIYGAVLYLNLIALIPAVVYAALTGHLDVFVPFYRPQRPGLIWSYEVDLYYFWQETPRWVFTSSLLIIRLINVLFAVGCVYLIYRIGTTMCDRATGRLSALLLTFTFGFIVMAHEGGEDIPMVFCLLCVIYLALRYVETGSATQYLAGCVLGGLAIGFKLSGAITVPVLGMAYLLRVRHAGADWRAALVRPRIIGAGLALGAIGIGIGYPSVLLTGLDPLIGRIHRGQAIKAVLTGGRVAPIWWWFLRGYLNGLGLPLFVAGVGGVAASVSHLRQRSLESAGIVLSVVVVGGIVLLLSRWEYMRVHHLLPTFPVIILLVSAAARRLHTRTPRVTRPLIALLVVTSALYTGVGTLGYATQPRDEAVEWLATHAPNDATIEVYVKDVQDVAVPHGMNTSHYGHGMRIGRPATAIPPRPAWMLSMPERCPAYIELTYQNLLYLAPPTMSIPARTHARHDRLQAYIHRLVYGDTDSYEVVATFGSRPTFLTGSPQPPLHTLPELVRIGVIPRTMQYGDEQDLGPGQYVLILHRTDRCGRPTNYRDPQRRS
jgi:4-amino-4-deoxy-L-arabinose transferase-like glycosyltransferase